MTFSRRSDTLNVSDTSIDSGDRVTFRGKLRSDWSQCFRNRPVHLFRGGNKVGTDITDNDGRYSFQKHPRSTANWRVKFNGRRFGTHPHVHRCRASQSRQVRVRVN